MEIKAKVLGFKKGTTKSGNTSLQAYFQVNEESVKRIFFCDPKDLIGSGTLTINAWGNEAESLYKTLFEDKLLNKDVTLIGSMINYNFNCCLISKA